MGIPSARADVISVDDIERWAGDLRSGDRARVEAAVQRLGHLPASALPAIEERLQRTRRQIIPEEDGYDALRYFRHAVGSRRADDMVDIAPGIPSVLLERPTPEVGRSAERVLVLRSLEAMGSVAGQRTMGNVFALTPAMWRWERRRLLDRMGTRLVPGLLWMKTHEEPGVRRWARAALAQLGIDSPGKAVQEEDPERLAGILEAYAEARYMDAMPVIISFVGHTDDRVRIAARQSMNRYGRNAIWQFREAMRNQLGQEADQTMGWERTASLLYEGLDAQRLAPTNTLIDEGLAAQQAGDLETALSRFDEVLLREPMHPRRSELAPLYATLAEQQEDPALRGSLQQRAAWLAAGTAAGDALMDTLLAEERAAYVAAGLPLAVEEEASTENAAAAAPEVGGDGTDLSGWWMVALALLGLAASYRWRALWWTPLQGRTKALLSARAPRKAASKTASPKQRAAAQDADHANDAETQSAGEPSWSKLREGAQGVRRAASEWRLALAKKWRARSNKQASSLSENDSLLTSDSLQEDTEREPMWRRAWCALRKQQRVIQRFLRNLGLSVPAPDAPPPPPPSRKKKAPRTAARPVHHEVERQDAEEPPKPRRVVVARAADSQTPQRDAMEMLLLGSAAPQGETHEEDALEAAQEVSMQDVLLQSTRAPREDITVDQHGDMTLDGVTAIQVAETQTAETVAADEATEGEDTLLGDEPSFELPPFMQSRFDTSPGTIEAPDTLPG